MREPKKMIDAEKPVISLETLKKLLLSLKTEQPSTQIRVNVSHRQWTDNFLSIGMICETDSEGKRSYAILFNDIKEKRTVLLKDIADITAFELDSSFESYKSNCEYRIMKVV